MIASQSNARQETRSLPGRQAGIPEILTLCLYGALLIFAIPYHEPWSDEAQAWEIVRSLPFARIFHALSYEGHPGLWYLLLWMMDRLHIDFAGVHWIAGAIAFAGVAVLVLASPFPRFIKLLLPFTFFLAFQYAVLARSYVLVPLLLFGCASLWPRKFEKPLTLALLLGLLANVVLHAAVISGGLAVVYLIDLWLSRGSSRQREIARAPARNFYAAGLLLLVLYGLAIWAAFPARDTSGAGLALHKQANAKITQALGAQQSQVQTNVPPEPARKKSLAWIAWKIQARLASGLTAGLTGSFLLGCLFWILMTWKLIRNRKLQYLIPSAFFVAFCAEIYALPWHWGMLMLCVIATLWMTWPEHEASVLRMPLYEQSVLLIFFVIILLQIGWTEFAVRFDHSHPYSPGRMTASFLAPFVGKGARIVEIGDDFLSVDAQQYFKHKLFLNEPYPYYWWSVNNASKSRYQLLLGERPEIVVIEWRFLRPPRPAEIAAVPMVPQLDRLGYRNTHTFCGGLVQGKRSFTEWDCELIYQPAGR